MPNTLKVTLASTSIYRRKLLERLGISFESCPPKIDEVVFKNRGLPPSKLAHILAEAKANSLKEDFPNGIIIGSDQVCALENKIFSKPGTSEKALNGLLELQGKTHHLWTGVSVVGPNFSKTWVHETKLTMKPLTKSQIETYINLDQPFDCAGAYKIEQHGIALFSRIETDDFTGIEGLPLIELSLELEKVGVFCIQ